MTKTVMLVGLEIECGIKFDLSRKLDIGGYHNSRVVNDDWNVETDSSLHPTKYGYKMLEFTSKPTPHTEVEGLLKRFKRDICDNRKFSDSMHINKSCGGHIHISLVRQENEESVILYQGGTVQEPYVTMRKDDQTWTIAGKPKNIPLTYPAAAKIRQEVMAILPKYAQRNYDRRYSRPNRKGEMTRKEKYNEWCMFDTNHFEYRSFNVTGLRSWNSFIAAYKKALSILYKNLVTSPTGAENVYNLDTPNIFIDVPHKEFRQNHRLIDLNRTREVETAENTSNRTSNINENEYNFNRVVNL